MDRGDIFYLIFAAIAAAISIYRGINKKRAAEAEAASTTTSVPEEYEEEDDWLMPVEPYVQPEPIRQPDIQPRPAIRDFAAMRIKPIAVDTADDEPTADRPEILNDADEVRKALIYAEILNRKY
ncbi:MAG: hypothetical protein LBD21_01300 [Tannerellaceae bacterium]|jgi:hypothetical protein|nr:hypothetical protein [Tannerellaceae bacterium]